MENSDDKAENDGVVVMDNKEQKTPDENQDQI